MNDTLAADALSRPIDRVRRAWEVTADRVPFLNTFASMVVTFGLVLILWQLLFQARLWPKALFPSPLAVFTAAVELTRSGQLTQNVVISLGNLVLGFSIASAIAFPLGILMGMNRVVGRLVDPLVNLLQAIPGLAWIPLAILWFGLNQAAVVFIIFMSAFFPIVFNTLAGVRATDRVLIDAALTLGAGRRHIVRHVILPSALPFMITGVRLGFGYGFRALVAGEMIAGSAGLGYMIFDARNYLRSDIVVLGMLVMGGIWLIIDRSLLKPLERRTIERWGVVAES